MHRRPSTRALLLAILLLVGIAGLPSAFAEETASRSNQVPAREAFDLLFPEPTSARDVYQALGDAFGVQMLFDPKLRDSKISIKIHGTTLPGALNKLNHMTGYFATAVDQGTLMIAEDTPQNHRTYERQVVQTFHLENIPIKDAMTMIRSLVGAKNVAASEALNGLVVRDTAAKVAVMERILQTIDRHQAEVAVEAEVLYLGGGERRAYGDRISPQELERLRSASRSLMSQEISVLENDTGRWALKDQLPAQVGDEARFLDVGLFLELRPRVHATSDEVTLELSFSLSDGDPGAGAALTTRSVESGARLASGETFLLSGVTLGADSGQEPSWLASRFDLPEGPGEVVVALTPRIVRGTGFTPSDLAAICVGTETHIELCDAGELQRAAWVNGPAPLTFRGEDTPLDDEAREEVRDRLRERLKNLPRGVEKE